MEDGRFHSFYRPQGRKVMFSEVSVSHSVHTGEGVCLQEGLPTGESASRRSAYRGRGSVYGG